MKRKQAYTIKLGVLCLFFVMGQSAGAAPYIKFERSLSEPGEGATGQAGPGEIFYQPKESISADKRNINKSYSKLLTKYLQIQNSTKNDHDSDSYFISEKQSGKFTYFEKKYQDLPTMNNYVAYVKHNDDNIMAYVLVSPMYIQDFLGDPVIQQITALSQDNNFISQFQNLDPQKIHLKSYLYDHGDFVERYVIMYYYSHSAQQDVSLLLLDAYYPKSLASVFLPEIKKHVNFYLNLSHLDAQRQLSLSLPFRRFM